MRWLLVAHLTLRLLVRPAIFCMKDGFKGQSAGKAFMGLVVIDVEKHEPIGFLRSFKRNLALMIPCVGIIGIILTMMKGRRWGDGWAKTKVVWKKYEYRVPFELRGILCITCGYNLTGNVSGICPECGTPIPTSASPATTEATAPLG